MPLGIPKPYEGPPCPGPCIEADIPGALFQLVPFPFALLLLLPSEERLWLERLVPVGAGMASVGPDSSL